MPSRGLTQSAGPVVSPWSCAAPAPVAAKASATLAAAAAPAAPPLAAKVSELLGTTVPFTGMQVAVSKNMVESLKVCCPTPLSPRRHFFLSWLI